MRECDIVIYFSFSLDVSHPVLLLWYREEEKPFVSKTSGPSRDYLPPFALQFWSSIIIKAKYAIEL